jgi:hypothetical protein
MSNQETANFATGVFNSAGRDVIGFTESLQYVLLVKITVAVGLPRYLVSAKERSLIWSMHVKSRDSKLRDG